MDCNIIKDLLPLYVEKLTSEASNILLEEHLRNCESCSKTLCALQDDIAIESKVPELNKEEELPYSLVKRIKQNIFEKILAAVSITFILGVLLGLFHAKIFRFMAFLGSLSIMIFTVAAFVSIPICRRKYSPEKQFGAMGYWVFFLSLLICALIFSVLGWYFSGGDRIYVVLVLEVLYSIVLTLVLRVYARLKLSKAEMTDERKTASKKLFLVTFATLICIIAAIAVPVTLLEANRVVDNVNLPFVNDPDILGKWTAVDFVESPEQFQPGNQLWSGDLYLRHMIFFEDGTMSVAVDKTSSRKTSIPIPWLLWTKNYVLHMGGDQTASKYLIKDMDGSKYMFLEWKNGDYVYFHKQPSYYVLKKEARQ